MEENKEKRDTEIYKKYIFGHSDDQNILLIHMWPSATVPDSQLPRSQNLLSVESDTGVFCYVNEMAFGSTLGWGLVVRSTSLVIGGLELSRSTSREGRGAEG